MLLPIAAAVAALTVPPISFLPPPPRRPIRYVPSKSFSCIRFSINGGRPSSLLAKAISLRSREERLDSVAEDVTQEAADAPQHRSSTVARCLSGVLTAHGMQSVPSNALALCCDSSEDVHTLAAAIPEKSNAASDNHLQSLVLIDLDPAATAKLAIGVMGPFLSAFGFLFILRIVMSWYPKLPVGKFPYVIAYAPTEPILSLTRKVIPPVGGVDVTPVVWFGLISFLNEILVGPQGLLVLLSRQV